jgi:hypothetical protein
MASSLKLRVSLVRFLADADRVVAMLDRDGDRLAAVTGGQVSAKTAEELRQLVATVREIEAKREKPPRSELPELKREAQRVVTRIAAVATWAAREDPVVAEQLRRLRREAPVRSVGIGVLEQSLAAWEAFARARSEAEPGGELVAAIVGAREGVRRLRRHPRQRIGFAHPAERDAAVRRIVAWVRRVRAARALLAVPDAGSDARPEVEAERL